MGNNGQAEIGRFSADRRSRVTIKTFFDLDPHLLATAGRASLIGLHMMSGVFVGAGIGWGLDRLCGLSPWLMIAFSLLGAAAGLRNVWKDVRRLLREQDAPPPDRPDGA
jgi:ATP synthase protein I